MFSAALRGNERMDGYGLLNLAVSLCQVALIWVLVRPGSPITLVAVILLAVQGTAAVLAGLICLRLIPGFWRAWRFSASMLPAVLRSSAPIALLGLLGILVQKLTVFMMAPLAGAAMTGWFSAALRVVEASKTGHLAYFGALYPALAQQASGNGSDAVTRSWKLVFAATGIVVLAVYFLADPLVLVLYGPAFEQSISALKILIWMMIPYTANTFISLSLLAAGREKSVARALLVSLVVLAVLSAWWIPRGGLSGACWSALVAESVQTGTLMVQSQGVLRGREARMGNVLHRIKAMGATRDLSELP